MTVQTIVQAFNQHDYEAARQAAHKIKGSAGNLGATVLSRCAHQLELSAQQSDAAAVEQALPELERIAEMTLESLRKRYH